MNDPRGSYLFICSNHHFLTLAAELKNANGYVIARRNRTWAQARAHLK